MGLNPGASREAAALGTRLAGEQLLTSLNDPAAEKLLREDAAIFDFVVGELGIDVADFARWDKATDVLLNADPHLREQLADLMRWLHRAEMGEIILERLVLSGHSNGVELWGEHEDGAESRPGTMVIERDLGTLAAAFPKAVGQIEDIMFSACFSITAAEIARRFFPNVQTAWSYGGFSPSVATGSIEEIISWSVATEADDTFGAGLEKRSGVALWTREEGYVVGDPAGAAVGPLYAKVVRGWREIAEPMYQGTKNVQKAALDRYYHKLQELIAHPGAAEDLRQKARLAFQAVLRLRFWPIVAKRFGTEHGAKLQPAYDALGLTTPRWPAIGRVELRAHVDAVRNALEQEPGAGGHADAIERYLMKGLYGLDPEIIRSDWV
jgi:hypothetical protein